MDKNFDEEMKALEKKKKALQLENQKLAQYLKEKEKEIRLNNLRLKELRKLTKLSNVKTGMNFLKWLKVLEREISGPVRRNSASEGRGSPHGSVEREKIHSRKNSAGRRTDAEKSVDAKSVKSKDTTTKKFDKSEKSEKSTANKASIEKQQKKTHEVDDYEEE